MKRSNSFVFLEKLKQSNLINSRNTSLDKAENLAFALERNNLGTEHLQGPKVT